ncbi:MAG: hypothetical protein ACRDTI_06485 [Mycobacterium sp.]
MPRYRNTVGGSVVNIDDGLATRLDITENPHWEPLDEHATPDPITPEDAPADALVFLGDIHSSPTWTATVRDEPTSDEDQAAQEAPSEAKAPTRGKSVRKPSNEPEEVKDASGSD